MKTNAFGHQLPEMRDLFADTVVEKQIRKTLLSVLNYLEIDNPKLLINYVIQEAKTCADVTDYERSVHQLFDQKRITQRIPLKLSGRAQTIFNQIKDSIAGHQVLDYGCGDGTVGALIAKQGRHVVLADIYESGNIANLNLPFVKLHPGRPLPFDKQLFDSTLLLTVLHHCDNPLQVLQEAVRVTKHNGKIIVLESVYGVEEYGKGLTNEQQRLVNMFFDHFYNRVIHYSEFEANKVPVPFNFQTPTAWKSFFQKNGLVQEKCVKLGFDQPTVPEYHTLHVLRVKK